MSWGKGADSEERDVKALVVLLAGTIPFAALGQTTAAPPPSAADQQQPRNAAQSSTDAPATVAALPSASVGPSNDHTSQLEALGLKGWITPFPKFSDTILGDTGHIRSTLADAGIGFLFISQSRGLYNLRDDDTPGARYNGRRPTYQSSSQTLYLTYDAGKIGLDKGQFQLSVGANTNGLTKVNGPRFVRIGTLAYYQEFGDDKVELKAGYFSNSSEFLGIVIAGNLAAGTLGPQATIPNQLGFGYGGIATPGVNVRINGKNGFYTKFGVQRSMPSGRVAEVVQKSATGLKFSYDGAKPLVVGELGVNRRSKPGQKSFWMRGGGIYNFSDYQDYHSGGRGGNWAMYAAVDKQLTQPDQDRPARGLYFGTSFNYAPPARNLYSQYYEARVYAVGPFKSRPSDLATFVLSYNRLGDAALRSIVPQGGAQDYVISGIGSYSYHLTNGIFLQPGLGVIKNATYSPKVPLAVNGYMGISFLF